MVANIIKKEESEPSLSASSMPDDANRTGALTKSLAREETRVVNILRIVVLCVLVVTAVLVSTVVYLYTRNKEEEQFSTNFEHSANQVIESFHSAVERNLAAMASLATSITSHALYANKSFPFVTVPDMELHGSDARAQSGSHYLYWAPLVDEKTRPDWEKFSQDNRHHWTESFDEETQDRLLQDHDFGLLQTGDSNNAAGGSNQTRLLQQTPTAPDLTFLDDGTGFHPRIWSVGAKNPLGDEAEGQGTYLPIWQQSPMNTPLQAYININMATVRLTSPGFLETMNTEKKALMHYAQPPLESFGPYFKSLLGASQYRHNDEVPWNDTHTIISYPVFDNFGEDREMAGVLFSGIYWKNLFTNILPSNSAGIVVVVENSFNETFAYQIDGDKATSLGVGDPHNSRYDDMEVRTNVNSHLAQRASPENRAYKTVHLSDSIQYTIRIFPSDDTAEEYLTNNPAIYTFITICVFLFASILFLLYSYVVERRQRIMMAKVIESVNKARATEIELNEFLSHEVRNPLSAAISACTFVSAAVNEEDPLKDKETRDYVRSDIEVVNSSLHFVNDFLRSMLDIYRATGNKITVALAPTDILQDILLPVSNIMNQRLFNFDVLVDCPPDLVVKTDSMRLKQVILNLVRNATKFVEQGFLRMRADVVDNQVTLYVEDSGPGISPQKQKELFTKYQESLDLLSQGTGIGLALSKKLMQIMKGDLYLSNSYNSGVPGYPGACFVVELRTPPIDIEAALMVDESSNTQTNKLSPETTTTTIADNSAVPVVAKAMNQAPSATALSTSTEATETTLNESKELTAREGVPKTSRPKAALGTTNNNGVGSEENELPEDLSVLFVDDDAVLRKLFIRAVKRAAPTSWKIQEASSGEVALKLCEEHTFSLIFLDQYMASVDKQLLGTETAEAMRTKGVKSKIVGLSANDLRDSFILAGADEFVLKPMPCKPNDLKQLLQRVLS